MTASSTDATSPLACRAVSNDGLVCDLQPKDHGGNMHSGLLNGDRVWWDRETGDLMDWCHATA